MGKRMTFTPRSVRRFKRAGITIRHRKDDEATTEMRTYVLPGQNPHLVAGDTVFVRTEINGPVSRWFVGFLIRVFTHTRKDKRPSLVNHITTIIRPIYDRHGFQVDYEIAEALGKGGFQFSRLRQAYGDQRKFSIAVVRYQPLTSQQRKAILEACEYLKGKPYGYGKIVAHVIDYALTKVWNLAGAREDIYLLRRLCTQEDYPMCSWGWLFQFVTRAEIPLDTPVSAGSPDDIWDEIIRKSPTPWRWLCATGSLLNAMTKAKGTCMPVGGCSHE